MSPLHVRSPLDTWWPDAEARSRFRRRDLGRAPLVLPPRDGAWRALAPSFENAAAMAGSGLPFHTVVERRYDRSGAARRLARALAIGATVYLPQVHQVLPRLARLMVALRATLLGPRREESSFLFLVEGAGREAMGLHHDGDVDAFWLQLEGRRTVTIGPPVARGTPADLPGPPRGPAWRTLDLEPGTLFHLPPFTPHRVVCRGRSLAVSLTWSRRRPARPRARETLVTWDVVGGVVPDRPSPDRSTLWTWIPVAAAAPRPGARAMTLTTADGPLRVPAKAWPLVRHLSAMPAVRRSEVAACRGLDVLLSHGILGPHDLPRQVVPADPRALDGWRFA